MFTLLNEIKLQTKLLSIFGLIIVVGVSITGWTIISINNLDTLARRLIVNENELAASLQVRNTLREVEMDELSYVLTRDTGFVHEHAIHMNSVTLYLRNAAIRAEDPTFRNLLFELEEQKTEYERHYGMILDYAHEGNWAAALEEGLISAALIEGMILKVDEIIAILEPQSRQQATASQRQVALSNYIGMGALAVFGLLTLGTGTLVGQQLVQPLIAIIRAAQDVIEDDFEPATLEPLTVRHDEIGQLAAAFLKAYGQIHKREMALEAEAADIRRKIATLQTDVRTARTESI